MAEEKLGHGYYVTIPTKILLDESLPAKARILFGFIANLSSMRGYCFASNAYLAQYTGWHEKTVSEYIGALLSKEYLYRLDEVTKNGLERRLFIADAERGGVVKGLRPPPSNDYDPLRQMTTQNNISIIIKDNNINAELENSANQMPLFSKEDNAKGDQNDINSSEEEDRSTEEKKEKKKRVPIKKEKEEKPAEYEEFIKIWCENYPTIKLGASPAIGGKMIKSLIKQTRQQLSERQIVPTFENAVEFWRIFVTNLGNTWANGADLTTVNSKYPSLIYLIENGTQRKTFIKLGNNQQSARVFGKYH